MADCRPVSAVRIRSACLVAATCGSSSACTASASATESVTRTEAANGSCSAWEIRSAATKRRVGGVVGEDRDLGRPGLGVDADPAAQQPLGRHDVDVAGAGDQVDRSHRRPAPRGRTSRSPGRRRPRTPPSTPSRWHIAEDVRVRQAAELGLGRAGDRDRRHAGHLGGHHVHQHAGRQRRQPTRARTAPPGRPAASRCSTIAPGPSSTLTGTLGGLRLGHPPAPGDGLGERRAHLRRQAGSGGGQLFDRYSEADRHHAVEALRVLGQRGRAALGHRFDDRTHLLDGRGHVELRARQHTAVVGEGRPTQVDGSQHVRILEGGSRPPSRPVVPGQARTRG